MPHTLPQDFTLFAILQQKSVETRQRKFDWIAEQGGVGLLITHPDYMVFKDFLEYVKTRHGDRCWYALPRDVVRAQRS